MDGVPFQISSRFRTSCRPVSSRSTGSAALIVTNFAYAGSSWIEFFFSGQPIAYFVCALRSWRVTSSPDWKLLELATTSNWRTHLRTHDHKFQPAERTVGSNSCLCFFLLSWLQMWMALSVSFSFSALLLLLLGFVVVCCRREQVGMFLAIFVRL